MMLFPFVGLVMTRNNKFVYEECSSHQWSAMFPSHS